MERVPRRRGAKRGGTDVTTGQGFQPGNSLGVKAGYLGTQVRERRKRIAHSLDEHLHQKWDGSSRTCLDRIVRKAIRQAIHGDRDARQWISDNYEGRPIQRIAHAFANHMVVESIDDTMSDEQAQKLYQLTLEGSDEL
jgi:hypothetical protein